MVDESLARAVALLHPQAGGKVVVTAAREAASLARLAEALGADGVGYLLARPDEQPGLRRLLRQHSLAVAEVRLHLPVWNDGLALVPLADGPVRYTLAHLVPQTSPRARLAALAGGQPGGTKLLAHLAPAIGLVVRRSSARPLFDWLRPLGVADGPLVVRTSGRRTTGATVLYSFASGHDQPAAVVKVTEHDLTDERHRLDELGPQARQSGAAVPQPLHLGRWKMRSVLVQSALPGQTAAMRLISAPRQLEPVLERLAAWLERWAMATRALKPLTPDWLRAALLAPAEGLAPELEGGGAYVAWLAERCAALAGQAVPAVAAHNDLTMWNVLLERDSLGVVDWESACPAALPLTDWFYAAVDAVAATHGYHDRPAAWRACGTPGSEPAAWLGQGQARLCAALGVSRDLAELCWHATWLQHAHNERAAALDTERPFLQIVQCLAQQPRPAAATATLPGGAR